MRVAVLDVGSNSTRLLIADVEGRSETVREIVRRSEVTRLGEGVDERGSLSEQAIERVMRTLADYRRAIEEHHVEANVAVLTAAVREAKNGRALVARLREELGFDARVLSGDEEAQLTFRGAMSAQAESAGAQPHTTVVVDIGGGSTEFVVGVARKVAFHVSLPVGVVRMSERHIRSDPPAAQELRALMLDVRATFERGLPVRQRSAAERGIAVAGTATSAAAIDQQLEPYDPARVDGYVLSLATAELLRERLAAMHEPQRRSLAGLHPDRAPTIVAGLVILCEALRAFALGEVTVSEHDLLSGGALLLADA